MNNAEKQKLIDGTLEWCNTIRAEQGKEPLTELPKGARRNPRSCPCGAATGMWVGRNSFNNVKEYIETAVLSRPLPPVVQSFVLAFDAGVIPELWNGELA